jgi:outer membrane immunogenic protein
MNFKLIKVGLAAAATVLCTAPVARAADVPIKAPYYKGQSVVAYYNWTGFYAGISGGYQWADVTYGGNGASFKTSPKGWMLGGTLGYNYQTGSVVWGIEGDISYVDLNDTQPSISCGTTCNIKETWLSTVRGRVGYAFDRWLPYVTGGLAYGNVKVSNAVGSADSTKAGWTAGVGLEYAFLGNWTAKLEYLYVDLGSASCGTAVCALPANMTADFTSNIVRAGLNYKFSGPVFSRF